MTKPPHNDFPRALRRARNVAQITQEAFGDVSGRTYISQLERGQRQVTLAKIDDLASVLHLHPASLVMLSYLPLKADVDAVDGLLSTLRAELLSMLYFKSE